MIVPGHSEIPAIQGTLLDGPCKEWSVMFSCLFHTYTNFYAGQVDYSVGFHWSFRYPISFLLT